MVEEEISAKEVINFFLVQMENKSFISFISEPDDRNILKADLKNLLDVVTKGKKEDNYFDSLIKWCQLIWKELIVQALTQIDKDTSGFKDLSDYFDHFAEFEELLYSTDEFYRDHTTHVLWTYFLAEWLVRKIRDAGIELELSPSMLPLQGIERAEIIFKKNDIIQYYKDNWNDSTITETELKKLEKTKLITKIISKKISMKEEDVERLPFKDIKGKFLSVLNDTQKEEDLNIDWINVLKSYEFIRQIYNIYQLEQAVRCVTFLCHDLGYPLKRITKISEKISGILEEFQAKETGTFTFSISGGLKDYLNKIIDIISGDFIFTSENKLIFKKNQPLHMSFLLDSETYAHGLMSALILSQKLSSILSNSIDINSEIEIEDMDICSSICKLRILKAIALHTNEKMKIKHLIRIEDLLMFVDFIEEFSRMTRASMLGSRIKEFCESSLKIYKSNGDFIFEITYEFSSIRPEKLNPEQTFKDKGEFIRKHFDFNNSQFPFKFVLKVIDNTFDDNKKKIKRIFRLNYYKNDLQIIISGFDNNQDKKKEIEKEILKNKIDIIIEDARKPLEKKKIS